MSGWSQEYPEVDVPPPWDEDQQLPTSSPDDEDQRRHMRLTSAADIKVRPVRWLWNDRLALGTLALLAGREGLGKSTLAYWLAARVTCGQLEGDYHQQPRGVLVCATEDSWEHTIVPRLMAAEADLKRIYRVEVLTDGIHVGLSLPRDIYATEEAAKRVDAGLMLLDPLMSRLGDLDTHRDSEVRIALEPLAALADRTRMSVLGLIHHNKSGATDPLQLVMGSKAFTAVARSVHTVVPDPDDDSNQRRIFGTPKNNLGRDDLPSVAFTIASHEIPTDEGPAWTGKVVWSESPAMSITDAMRAGGDEDRTATSEAADWLTDYLTMQGGTAPSAEIQTEGRKAGHAPTTLKRARQRRGIVAESSGFPRKTFWSLPGTQSDHQSDHSPRGDGLTGLTGLTEGILSQSDLPDQLGQALGANDPTGATGPLNGSCLTCGRPLTRVEADRGVCSYCQPLLVEGEAS